MIYRTYSVGGELYHHGILGQRWGKRNGPPYPLDGSDHSQSEKKAGWRKSLGGEINNKINEEIDKKYKELTRVTEEHDTNRSAKTEDNLNRTYAEYELLVEDAMKHIKDYSRKERKYIKEKYKKLTFPDDEVSNKYREEARLKRSKEKVDKIMKDLGEYGKEMNEDIDVSLKAKDKALSWYKKNDPKGLQKMLNEVGGKEEDLDITHDFRKLVEGYESELYGKKRRR